MMMVFSANEPSSVIPGMPVMKHELLDVSVDVREQNAQQ